MRVGVTVVNLNPVSAPDWLYGLGFLTWEKQQSNSHNNKTHSAKSAAAAEDSCSPRLNIAGVIPARVACLGRVSAPHSYSGTQEDGDSTILVATPSGICGIEVTAEGQREVGEALGCPAAPARR